MELYIWLFVCLICIYKGEGPVVKPIHEIPAIELDLKNLSRSPLFTFFSLPIIIIIYSLEFFT